MKIGIIGTGAIGKAFAGQAAKAGYEIVISNSRGAASLEAIAKQLGSKVKAGSIEEAATADVVFLGLPWKSVEAVTSSVPSWKGRIVIDPTNPIINPGFIVPDLGGAASSEVVAKLVPGASVVKAFNTFPPEILATDPKQAGGKRVIFYSGNDAAAKQVVAGIISRIGFAGIDLGTLHEGGRLQQFPGGPLPALNLIKM
ncbi:NADP oxidoreductase [Chitinophaga sp. ysch24]|uniref:NADP oxidoreductase n=2 Tax=Chitinophaga tropicalis TaxID=2683588 RepID=A0A7K1UCA8_9BACT|nr:NADP oxidoreductase [Chitinophaga tropicalis]